MTISEVMLWVDKQDITTITENEVVEYVESKVGKNEHAKVTSMFGIARLAGKNQIAGNLEEWKRLISILRKNYWS